MNYFYYDALQRRHAVLDSDGLSYFTWDRNNRKEAAHASNNR